MALALPRAAEIVIALLAVSKAGGAYLPLDPDVSGAAAGVHGARRRAAFLVLDGPGRGLGRRRVRERADGRRSHRTARARPPRVRHLHLRLDRDAQGRGGHPPRPGQLRRGLRRAVRVGPGARVLQFASPSFDASVLELCTSLLSGAALVTGEEGPLAGERLAEVLAQREISHTLIPPAALATVDTPPPGGLPALRSLVVGARGLPGRPGRPLGTGAPAGQLLRPHRIHRGRHLVRPAHGGQRHPADRPPGREHQGLRPRRRAAAGPAGGRRRAVPGRAPAWPAATWAARA